MTIKNSIVVHKFVTGSAEETQEIGVRLAKTFLKGAVVYISGDIGVGKSTFAQGVGAGLGIQAPVTSPSFSLVETYALPAGTLCHIDLFRSIYAREWLDAGLDETIANCCLCLIEWPDKGEMLPPADIRINIKDTEDDRRVISLEGCTALGTKWLAAASF